MLYLTAESFVNRFIQALRTKNTGQFKELFRNVDRIDKVTKADIRRVANKTFVETNRTVGISETVKPTAASAQGGAQ